jgi:glutaminyl-tRNA synthetase
VKKAYGSKEIYDGLVAEAGFVNPPTQIEFARLELDYTVLSKRKLLRLVNEGHVNGWDDPRMPTMAALRRRGVRPDAIRAFADAAGVTRNRQLVEIGMFEHAVRDDLNMRVPRVLCVVKPLKLVVTNYPEELVEELEAPYYPHDVPKEGTRLLPFSREIWIDRDDFMEDPPKKFFRLAPGREVRLRYGYLVTATDVIKDAAGEVVELHCTYDPATKGGNTPDGRKVQGTIHCVGRACGLRRACTIGCLRSRTRTTCRTTDFLSALNPTSLVNVHGAKIEPSVAGDAEDTRYQFERVGYFWRDPEDSRPESLVFNRIVGLRDSWAKVAGKR